MFRFNSPLLDSLNDDQDDDQFCPKEEGHHCDGSGIGPADTWIIRHGHEQIHSDVAEACRMLGEKIKGFYGDPTTLKLGNKFFGKEEETPDYLKTYKIPEIKMSFFKIEEQPKYELPRTTFITNFLNTNKDKTPMKRANEILESIEINTKPSYMNFIKTEQPKPSFGVTKLTENMFDNILRTKKETINLQWHKVNETPAYRANQDNWLGGRNSFTPNSAWSIDMNIHHSPVLKPLFTNEDSYITAFNVGNKIFNDTLKKVEAQNAEFEHNNLGWADFENNIYKRDMISVGRLSDTPMQSAMPSLPSASYKSVSFGQCTYKSAWGV
jgi:hypothetical protein